MPIKKKVLWGLIFLLLISANCSHGDGIQPEHSSPRNRVNGIRIAWDYSTLKQLSPVDANYSGYARMIRLADNRMFCVYESDGTIQFITSNDAKNWSAPVTLAVPENGIPCYVPDVLQLTNGSLLVMYNMRPPGNNTDPSKVFSIRVKKSEDGGISWSDHQEIYRAGHEFHNGCWEPSAIQLPSGEVQLFIANEGPYTNSNEQEITMFRSVNDGESWTTGEKVSFRAGYRDGMPVPLVLQNGEIVLAIEDNGIMTPEFKPVIIRTTNNWANASVSGQSADRALAFDEQSVIGGSLYGGAPYIRQLASGETMLSYQSTERKPQNPWDRSDMIVCIGDATARNFNRKSTPFYTTDVSKTALWNSVTVESDTSVIALASTNAYSSKTGVWMIRGYIQKEVRAVKQTVIIDNQQQEPLWNEKPQVFIGGYGKTQADLNFSWDADNLYMIASVKDEAVFGSTVDVSRDDGLEFLLDPQQKSTTDPVKGVYSIHVTAGGHVVTREGKSGIWVSWKPAGVEVSAHSTNSGYRIELAIPWSQLKTDPAAQMKMGFHVILHESKTGGRIEYKESIAGNIDHAPYTWSAINLEE